MAGAGRSLPAPSTTRKILLLVSGLTAYGGLEERVVALAIALRLSGHSVRVSSYHPIPPGNPYRQRLHAAGVPCVAPPAVVSTLAGNWQTKAHIVEVATRAVSPALVVVAAALALVRRQPLARAWQGVLGRTRVCLGWLVLLKVLDWSFSWLLAVQCRLHGKPDVVHVHGYRFDRWPGVVWASKGSIASVYEEHSSPSSTFAYPEEPFTSPHKPAVFLTVSAAGLSELSMRLGPSAEVVMVPPIIERCAHGAPVRRAARTRDDLVVTCIARLIPEKGVEDLLTAAGTLSPKYPHSRLAIYGDGPLRPALEARARQLGLDGVVSFRGPFRRDELAAIMQDTDIFVLPSLTEGLPLALIEAMAWGRAVVATRVGGIPDVVTDGATGLLVPPGDPAALARGLALLMENGARRACLGQAAAEAYLASGFTRDAVVRQMLAIYERALQRSSAAARPQSGPRVPGRRAGEPVHGR
jgi:glycosyltransferase involved in cell wall biosynthesis